jgi:hypothetical protein
MLVAVVAVVQLSAIFLVHIPRVSTGLVAIPLMLIEGLALSGLFNWIERRFPRSESVEQ